MEAGLGTVDDALARGVGGELPGSPFLAEWLDVHARERPDAPAVDAGTTRLTYAELAERATALAGSLARRGVEAGTRVLLALPNTPATIVAGLAINRLGAISVEVSRDWSADVLGEIVERTATRHLVVAARDGVTWARALEGGPAVQLWIVQRDPTAPGVPEALARHDVTVVGEDAQLVDAEAADAPDAAPQPDWPALILYTSGSTGRPHGVIQTHRNIDANSRSIVEYLGLTAADRALLALPLYYCYGRSVLQTHLLVGGSVVLEGRMAFPRVVLETMAAEGCTGFAGVPLTFEILRRKVDVASMAFPRLRYLTQAGGAMAPDTIAWTRAAFAPARLFVMYGQTEATARLSYLPPEHAQARQGSIGIPIPGVELRVVDDSGRELPAGKVGELVARGANVTPGYFDDPDETAEILHDGWLWTGDLAERDADGFLYHRGRARELLKIGGRRVSPAQIEEVVARHPDVDEVAVVGLPDALMGQVALALVVPRPGVAIDIDGIVGLCRANLPAPLVPRVARVERLPRNEAGKLLRAELLASLPASSAGPAAGLAEPTQD
jgi:long-chain acyl-CoA synthetase